MNRKNKKLFFSSKFSEIEIKEENLGKHKISNQFKNKKLIVFTKLVKNRRANSGKMNYSSASKAMATILAPASGTFVSSLFLQ